MTNIVQINSPEQIKWFWRQASSGTFIATCVELAQTVFEGSYDTMCVKAKEVTTFAIESLDDNAELVDFLEELGWTYSSSQEDDGKDNTVYLADIQFIQTT